VDRRACVQNPYVLGPCPGWLARGATNPAHHDQVVAVPSARRAGSAGQQLRGSGAASEATPATGPPTPSGDALQRSRARRQPNARPTSASSHARVTRRAFIRSTCDGGDHERRHERGDQNHNRDAKHQRPPRSPGRVPARVANLLGEVWIEVAFLRVSPAVVAHVGQCRPRLSGLEGRSRSNNRVERGSVVTAASTYPASYETRFGEPRRQARLPRRPLQPRRRRLRPRLRLAMLACSRRARRQRSRWPCS
jgi:hypothetical protein